MVFFAVMAEAPEDVRARVERAREDVALAEATEVRIGERLAALEADAGADAEAVKAMRGYLAEVRAMREAYEVSLAELELLAAEVPDPAVAEGMRAFSESLAALPSAGEEEDGELGRMIAEFEASLSEFDGVIAEHVAGVRQRMDRRMEETAGVAGPRAQAAAEAAELLRSLGVDPGVGGAEGAGAGAEAGSGEATGGARVAGSERGGRNEDIVARQLREAAEKETDPELREKLWKEYEAYLDGRS